MTTETPEQDMSDAGLIIETTDEDGQTHIFEKVSEYELEGSRYALMVYHGGADDEDSDEKDENAEPEEDEFVVFRVGQDEEGLDMFEGLEEDELERIVAHIEELADGDEESDSV